MKVSIMRKEQLDRLKSWFAGYVAGFYGDDDYINANLRLKDIHTEYVCCEARYIADGIGLTGSDMLIAEVVALMHDVGRFEQFSKYLTYSDRKSVDHSKLAIEIIEKENVLAELDEADRDVVLTAVRLHNLKDLPDGLDEKTLLHCRIIRDADKLDIYRVLLEKYKMHLADPEGFKLELEHPDDDYYSEIMIESLMNEQQIDYNRIKTLNDMKLLLLAMVYDINFKPTFVKIKQEGYLQEIIEMLPGDEEIAKVREKILSYIDNAIG